MGVEFLLEEINKRPLWSLVFQAILVVGVLGLAGLYGIRFGWGYGVIIAMGSLLGIMLLHEAVHLKMFRFFGYRAQIGWHWLGPYVKVDGKVGVQEYLMANLLPVSLIFLGCILNLPLPDKICVALIALGGSGHDLDRHFQIKKRAKGGDVEAVLDEGRRVFICLR